MKQRHTALWQDRQSVLSAPATLPSSTSSCLDALYCSGVDGSTPGELLAVCREQSVQAGLTPLSDKSTQPSHALTDSMDYY
ncbi:hypothetical protein RRG08_045529 [Elysia crispata]|uniref:Uncharacterized protein n=1 Tax=Elysia crispata TaxID=231223 RepID=A0AAE0YDB2_9GAST|nr:hypothetical protein RRG08_045529 [Elysia crispata]